MTKRPLRTAGGVLATAVLLATTLGGPAAADPLPEFDFADCPTLPAGTDPAAWRCEVFVATGTFSFGSVRDLPLRMRLTFAEGRIDGRYAQKFGALRAEPARLAPWLALHPRYGGHSDFQANPERFGEIDLTMAVRGPFVPRGCTIGTEAEPIHSAVQLVAGREVTTLPGNPPVTVRWAKVRDERLAVPAAEHCGPWTRSLGQALGLPAPEGNRLELESYVAIRGYS